MFVAKRKDGELIYLLGKSKAEIEQLKKEVPFFCPTCQQEVLLRAGPKKLPHFSHRHFCPSKPEGESYSHLLGKKLLFEWFEHQGYQPILEFYMKELKQRPDLCFHWMGKTIAVEFQCSVIPSLELYKRNHSYLEFGILPLWIIHDAVIPKQNEQFLLMSDFLSFFLHDWQSSAPYLLSFQPESRHFQKYMHLLPFTVKQFFYQKRSFPMTTKFTDLLLAKTPFQFSKFISKWSKQIEKWVMYSSLNIKARIDPLLQTLYYSSLHPVQLPKEVGIPVPDMYRIETHPIKWQAHYWHHFFYRKPIGYTFSTSDLMDFSHQLKNNGYIKWRELPNVKNQDGLIPIKKYLLFLAKSGFLKIVGQKYMILMKPKVLTNDRWQQERKLFFMEKKNVILSLFH